MNCHLTVAHCGLHLFRTLEYQRENRLRDFLGKFVTLHKVRVVYHWEVGADTKLYPDLALGNSPCTCGFKPKSEKPLFPIFFPFEF